MAMTRFDRARKLESVSISWYPYTVSILLKHFCVVYAWHGGQLNLLNINVKPSHCQAFTARGFLVLSSDLSGLWCVCLFSGNSRHHIICSSALTNSVNAVGMLLRSIASGSTEACLAAAHWVWVCPAPASRKCCCATLIERVYTHYVCIWNRAIKDKLSHHVVIQTGFVVNHWKHWLQ